MFFNVIFFFYLNPPADDQKKVDHLTSLDGAKERLHLFKADLLEEGSFDAVVEGCEGVFHTASPFYLGVKDPQVPHSIFLINMVLTCIAENLLKFPLVHVGYVKTSVFWRI